MSTQTDKMWAALLAKAEAKGQSWREKQNKLYPPKTYTEDEQRAALLGLAAILSISSRRGDV